MEIITSGTSCKSVGRALIAFSDQQVNKVHIYFFREYELTTVEIWTLDDVSMGYDYQLNILHHSLRERHGRKKVRDVDKTNVEFYIFNGLFSMYKIMLYPEKPMGIISLTKPDVCSSGKVHRWRLHNPFVNSESKHK